MKKTRRRFAIVTGYIGQKLSSNGENKTCDRTFQILILS